MKDSDRDEAKLLRGMSSEDAASWVIAKHEFVPRTLSCRSWERADQKRLLKHYFPSNFSFGSSNDLSQFLTFMSVRLFWKVIEHEIANLSEEQVSLLVYYLPSVVGERQRSDKETRAGEDIVDFLNARLPSGSLYRRDQNVN